MAQLKDSTIDGNLGITGDILLKTNETGIKTVHPESGEASRMLHMSQYGNTIIGYDGYTNQNGNTHVYGNDVVHYVASAGNSNFRPYYRAGDILNFDKNNTYIRTSGYVTNAMKNVVFTIPLTKPIIGSPTAQVSSSDGLVLRQNGNYTHGSGASVFAKPTGYDVYVNPDVGLVVTAYFDDTTNAVNNDPIGIYWSGTIALS